MREMKLNYFLYCKWPIDFRGDFGLSSFQLRVYIFKLENCIKLKLPTILMKSPLTEFNIDRFH